MAQGSDHCQKHGPAYQDLVDELYAGNDPVTLGPEYGYFLQQDLIRMLIRLARYKFVARLIKKTDRVLEVGCGSGLGAVLLSQHCAEVTGLDVNSRELDEARRTNRRENLNFVLGLVPKLVKNTWT